MADGNRQLVKSGFVEAGQRFHYPALLIEKESGRDRLRIVSQRELQSFILSDGVTDAHLPDELVGARLIVLGNGDDLNAVVSKSIEIRQSQLARGTVGLKEDQEGLLPRLIARNSRCDSGLLHESQDFGRSARASD